MKPPPTVRVGESHETVCWLYEDKKT